MVKSRLLILKPDPTCAACSSCVLISWSWKEKYHSIKSPSCKTKTIDLWRSKFHLRHVLFKNCCVLGVNCYVKRVKMSRNVVKPSNTSSKNTKTLYIVGKIRQCVIFPKNITKDFSFEKSYIFLLRPTDIKLKQLECSK